MKVTFIIGNGFDLACGLKTSYYDVLAEYCETHSENDNIAEFKEYLLEHKNDINDIWTDFEMGLPKLGEELNNFDKFKACVLDFTLFLNDYLKEQEKLINTKVEIKKIVNLVTRYFYDFNEFCLRMSEMKLTQLMRNINYDTSVNFVTFNYTNTLEKCLYHLQVRNKNSNYKYYFNSPLHIHSTLDNGIRLGLDDESLYKNIPCEDIRKLKNLIDKIHINSHKSDIVSKTEKLLQESNIVVIIGWSMGKSDSYWVNTLKKLFEKNAIELVYFPYYNEDINMRLSNEQLDREDEGKDHVIKMFNFVDTKENRDRIHIISHSSYLKLDFLSKNNEDCKELITV